MNPCPPKCDCERFPIYGVVKLEGDKVPKLQRIATGVTCKREEQKELL